MEVRNVWPYISVLWSPFALKQRCKWKTDYMLDQIKCLRLCWQSDLVWTLYRLKLTPFLTGFNHLSKSVRLWMVFGLLLHSWWQCEGVLTRVWWKHTDSMTRPTINNLVWFLKIWSRRWPHTWTMTTSLHASLGTSRLLKHSQWYSCSLRQHSWALRRLRLHLISATQWKRGQHSQSSHWFVWNEHR